VKSPLCIAFFVIALQRCPPHFSIRYNSMNRSRSAAPRRQRRMNNAGLIALGSKDCESVFVPAETKFTGAIMLARASGRATLTIEQLRSNRRIRALRIY
jgi:hypothetical protein